MSGISHRILFILAALLLSCLAAGNGMAAPVAKNIPYQGKLTDAGGNPLTGTYTVTFRLYNVSTGGTALDTAIQDIPVERGYFTTVLPFNPALFDGSALWLGVKAGADPEMTPRQEIRPVPYALELAGGVTGQVLTIVTDIQQKVAALLTKLTTLQADVTTVKTIAIAIDDKLDAPPQPIRYEYYSAPMYTLKTLSSMQDFTTVTNSGDSAANVCYYKYLKQGIGDFILRISQCITLPAGKTQSCSPTLIANSTYQWKVKITTNSSRVIPYTSLIEGSGPVYADVYRPGDFQVVEVYE